VINLLCNARDAMPNGGSDVIRTGFELHTQRLTLTVSDTGRGIPKPQARPAYHENPSSPIFREDT
jgi:signal transduction histidine kinase